jgi:hypothetical protein
LDDGIVNDIEEGKLRTTMDSRSPVVDVVMSVVESSLLFQSNNHQCIGDAT